MISLVRFLKPPNFYNIRKFRAFFRTEKEKMSKDLFMTFDEFKNGLGSWAKPLETYTNGKTFQNIYKFVKTEYESGKKVRMIDKVDLSTKGINLQLLPEDTHSKHQGCHCWPGSLPSAKASTWIVFQRYETCSTTSITQKYVQKHGE